MIKKLFGIGLEERVNALEEDFKNLKIEVDKNTHNRQIRENSYLLSPKIV